MFHTSFWRLSGGQALLPLGLLDAISLEGFFSQKHCETQPLSSCTWTMCNCADMKAERQ